METINDSHINFLCEYFERVEKLKARFYSKPQRKLQGDVQLYQIELAFDDFFNNCGDAYRAVVAGFVPSQETVDAMRAKAKQLIRLAQAAGLDLDQDTDAMAFVLDSIEWSHSLREVG